MISVIMPVFNEETLMDQLLDLLTLLQNEQTELIIIDGGSSDRTVPLIESSGIDCQVLHSQSGRGNQLIAGVDAASGNHYFFLHADARFLTSPIPVIEETLQNHELGAFTLAFDSTNPWMKMVAFFSNQRVKKRHIAFGDQGMFMTRHAYETIGGFKAISLMEDYDFSLRARDEANLKFYQVKNKIITSARKFEQVGVFKLIWRMQKCQYLFRRGVDPDKINQLYRK